MSAFSNAIAGGLKSIRQVAGETVRYVRGEQEIAELSAVLGKSDFVGTDSEGVTVTATAIDWIVEAAELVFDDAEETFLPEMGDQIEHTIGEVVNTYEVQPGADNEVWKYCDEQGQTTIRIHCKRMGVSP